MARSFNTFTPAMVQAAALRCPINLGHGKGPVRVDASTGDWFAYPAKSEPVRRWRRACIDDLRQRKIRGGSYEGDVGHCLIGGKRFSLYPYCGYICRDDFVQWAEANFGVFWDSTNHREKLPEKPKAVVETIEPDLKIWKEIRALAREMKAPTDLMNEGSFNSLYEMKRTLAEYSLEIRRDEARNQFYIGTKVLADHLAATIAFREKHYPDAIHFFKSCAASCLRAALMIQEQHGSDAGKGDAE